MCLVKEPWDSCRASRISHKGAADIPPCGWDKLSDPISAVLKQEVHFQNSRHSHIEETLHVKMEEMGPLPSLNPPIISLYALTFHFSYYTAMSEDAKQLLKHLVVGINGVTKSLEKNELNLVLVGK